MFSKAVLHLFKCSWHLLSQADFLLLLSDKTCESLLLQVARFLVLFFLSFCSKHLELEMPQTTKVHLVFTKSQRKVAGCSQVVLDSFYLAADTHP